MPGSFLARCVIAAPTFVDLVGEQGGPHRLIVYAEVPMTQGKLYRFSLEEVAEAAEPAPVPTEDRPRRARG